MGPKSRRLVAEVGAGWLNFGSDLESLIRDAQDLKAHWQSLQGVQVEMRNTCFSWEPFWEKTPGKTQKNSCCRQRLGQQ